MSMLDWNIVYVCVSLTHIYIKLPEGILYCKLNVFMYPAFLVCQINIVIYITNMFDGPVESTSFICSFYGSSAFLDAGIWLYK